MTSLIHQGKTAVVTGGAMGFGQATAVRLARDGADVVIADLAAADETVSQIRELGRRAHAIQCDVSRPEDVERLGEAIGDQFGRCDILVNNAGVFVTRKFEDISFADWKRTFAINLDSMFLTTKAVIAGMKNAGWGRIINIASNTLGSVVPDHVDYIASKGGVVGFTRALASEFGTHGITVNAIAPGLTHTPGAQRSDFLPRGRTVAEAVRSLALAQAIKRPANPSDIAGVVSFLASDDAGFMSGQTLYVDGGLVRT